jgi:hypothetical protein
MLTFKKNIVRQYFSKILYKASKEPIGIIKRKEITNVIISYEVYQKLLDAYMQPGLEKNIEEYFKLEKNDEALYKADIIR